MNLYKELQKRTGSKFIGEKILNYALINIEKSKMNLKSIKTMPKIEYELNEIKTDIHYNLYLASNTYIKLANEDNFILRIPDYEFRKRYIVYDKHYNNSLFGSNKNNIEEYERLKKMYDRNNIITIDNTEIINITKNIIELIFKYNFLVYNNKIIDVKYFTLYDEHIRSIDGDYTREFMHNLLCDCQREWNIYQQNFKDKIEIRYY